MLTVASVAALALAAPHVTLNAPQVHPERAIMVSELNTLPGMTWKAAVNGRFASQAPGAAKPLCGVKGDWAAQIRARIDAGEIDEFVADESMEIPTEFDSATNWPHCAKTIGDIRDQSNCGCCWAFAGAEAASDRMCIATEGKMLMPLSAQDVCFCANPNGCDGGMIDTPFDFIASKGAVTGGQYESSGPFGAGYCSDFTLPHCHHHGPVGKDPYPSEGQPGCESQTSPSCPSECGANASAPHNSFASDKYTFEGRTVSASGEKAIQQLIMTGGPVETAFSVYSDFENYAGGVYQHTGGQMLGGHAVKFVGWGVDNGVKYWKVANSWNPYWGEEGYFRIVRGLMAKNGGIEQQVTGSPNGATWSKKN
jgi:cathepsin B